MSKLADIRKIADLSYESDPENDGYVAEVGSKLLADSYADQLSGAGYETSTSKDEEGRWFVWVM